MHVARLLLFVLAFCSPGVLNAAGQDHPGYTLKEDIRFSNTTRTAFDHSGQMVVHTTSSDGSISADHNGSIGNVTVARISADGRIETYCTTNEAAATAWMAGEDGSKPDSSLNTPVLEK